VGFLDPLGDVELGLGRSRATNTGGSGRTHYHLVEHDISPGSMAQHIPGGTSPLSIVP